MRSVFAALLLCACSGGGGGGTSTPPPPPPPPPPPAISANAVWGLSPFPAACGGAGGTAYVNAEVEPHIAVNPRDANHLVGVWQQDRWSNGSARGLLTGVSFDAGATWSAYQVPFSECSGGNAANGGDFFRATDPWVTFAADGTIFQAALSTNGGTFAPGSRNAVLVSRSTDGGLTWSTPIRVNADPGVVAFTPQVHVRADGVVGISYFDLRSNTPDAITLLADYWLARSSDGVNFTETRIAETFNLASAPLAAGALFLGDYMGLASSGTTFLPFFTRTTGIAGNATDVFLARIAANAVSSQLAREPKSATPMPSLALDPLFSQRAFANLAAGRAQRPMR